MIDFEKLCLDNNIEHSVEGHHHCHQGWIQVHCPFCADGSYGWHLGFSLEKGNMNCWRCGKITLWDYLSNILHNQSIQKILKKYDLHKRIKPHKIITRKRKIEFPTGTSDLKKPHIDYLKKRGFNPDEIIEKWKIKATTYLSGAWNWRIIIPIFDKQGNMVSYQGRIIKENINPKYKTLENEKGLKDFNSLIYGIEKVKDSVIITEGVMDVWKLGFGAVALFGIDWKIEQANELRKIKNRFILFDPEPQAQKKAQELANWLSYFSGDTKIIKGLSSDPGSLTPKQIIKIKTLFKGKNDEKSNFQY